MPGASLEKRRRVFLARFRLVHGYVPHGFLPSCGPVAALTRPRPPPKPGSTRRSIPPARRGPTRCRCRSPRRTARCDRGPRPARSCREPRTRLHPGAGRVPPARTSPAPATSPLAGLIRSTRPAALPSLASGASVRWRPRRIRAASCAGTRPTRPRPRLPYRHRLASCEARINTRNRWSRRAWVEAGRSRHA